MRKILLFSILGLLGMQAKSQDIPEYCLENDVVHRYLTEVQYDPNDYSYSKIRDYCYDYPWNWEELGHGVRLDFPKPVPFKFTKAVGNARTLYISEYEDYEGAWTYALGQDVDTLDVYNLIPGRTYLWKTVYDDAGVMTVAESGVFKTTGHLRMLKIDNVFNVRDMGGWIGLGGKPLKYGKIVRGSRLNVNKSTTLMITQNGIDELRKIGMRSELDMRDASNSVNATHAFFGNDCPILNVNAAYNSRIATFANGPQSIQGINQLIAWLKEGKPVYLHCSVGADRTGTVAYLVGALCGMSEDALCKEFELTSFSGDKIDNEAVRNPKNLQERYERLIRQRDNTGRLDPNDNNNSYKFSDMVAKIKTYPGATLQQKVYYHLKTGVNGTKVSEADLRWLIKEMTGFVMVEGIGLGGFEGAELEMEPADELQLTPQLKPVDADTLSGIKFTSSNPAVATVSETGLVTAVRGGTTTITVSCDGVSAKMTVTVPVVEADVPEYALYNNVKCPITNKNRINNGSFEYAIPLYYWYSGTKADLTAAAFDVKPYATGDSVYIESKVDGEPSSTGSIRTEWKVSKNKDYVFGYRVKNSTDLKTENNENLVLMLTTSTAETGQILEYPSYDGNWTDIQVIFNSGNYTRLRAVFSHLSQNGNNTCFDGFYLAEIDLSTGIRQSAAPAVQEDEVYDLLGRKVPADTKGILIRNGKKCINY